MLLGIPDFSLETYSRTIGLARIFTHLPLNRVKLLRSAVRNGIKENETILLSCSDSDI